MRLQNLLVQWFRTRIDWHSINFWSITGEWFTVDLGGHCEQIDLTLISQRWLQTTLKKLFQLINVLSLYKRPAPHQQTSFWTCNWLMGNINGRLMWRYFTFTWCHRKKRQLVNWFGYRCVSSMLFNAAFIYQTAEISERLFAVIIPRLAVRLLCTQLLL